MKYQALVTYTHQRMVDVVANDLNDARLKLERVIHQTNGMVGTPEFDEVEINIISQSITRVEGGEEE